VKRAAFLTSAALAVAAVGLDEQPSVGATLSVRAAGTPSDDSVSLVYAQKAGLFQKAGLDVDIERQSSGAAVAAAVASGAYDIGKSSITSLFDAHQRGIPFLMIAPSVVYDSAAPYAGLIVRKDAGMRTGKDANNGVVAVAALSDIGRLAMQAWVDQNGGDPATLRFVEIPFPAVPAAVDEGRVIAGEMSMPTMAAALATGKFRLIPAYDAIATSYLNTAWFTTADYAAKNPPIIRTFARVLGESASYTNKHHRETAAMMADFTGASLDIINHMTRATDGIVLTPEEIQPVIDAAVKYGTIKRAFLAQELIYKG
jgi:ABC-type nitrate/sulfonate/bicarbonate transport system substrate-binding protein